MYVNVHVFFHRDMQFISNYTSAAAFRRIFGCGIRRTVP